MRINTFVKTSFFAVVLCSSAASAQSASVRILQGANGHNFAVVAFSETGGTPEEAGRLAMLKGCEATRERGLPFYGVGELTLTTDTALAQTQSEGTDLVLNQQGQAVGAVHRSAEHRTAHYGHAFMTATMMSEDGADMLAPAMQIVDVRTCTVQSRPDR